jgi:hypothetical protein
VLSILVWWAVPAVAVLLATAVLTASRRIRRTRDDVGSLRRYQHAREVLARTQHSIAPHSHSESERNGVRITE